MLTFIGKRVSLILDVLISVFWLENTLELWLSKGIFTSLIGDFLNVISTEHAHEGGSFHGFVALFVGAKTDIHVNVAFRFESPLWLADLILEGTVGLLHKILTSLEWLLSTLILTNLK